MLGNRLRSRFVGIALLSLVLLALVPMSVSCGQGGEDNSNEAKRAEKFVELAQRAYEQVGNFINLTYANETAIETITGAGLYDELEGNKTLFKTWGLGNLTEAKDALEDGNYRWAIANATEALRIFREVFKAFKTILADSGVQRGQLVDAQGLIEAMKRALDRIERLKERLGPAAPPAILQILESAEKYLNISKALVWLSQGRVDDTVWNKTQANKLISMVHSLLQKRALELRVKRIQSYLRIIEKFYGVLDRLVDRAVERGLPGAEALKTELEDVEPLIDGAKSDLEATPPDIVGAIAKLVKARNALREIERDLLQLRRR